MSFQSVDLSTVDRDQVNAAALQLSAMLRETDANLDLSPGTALSQFIVDPWALLSTINAERIDTIVAGWSLQDLLANPATSSTLIDRVLANYFIVRRPADRATGRVVIVLNTAVTTPIPGTTVLTTNGKKFTADEPYVGVVESTSVLSDVDRLIRPRGDGKFAFVIDVTAVDAGAESRAARDTVFTISPDISGLHTAYAESDFSNGQPAETNTELAARLSTGIAASSTADRASIRSLIIDAVPTTRSISIIGAGDIEMLRDRHNLFNAGTGGKADIYVRTDYLPAQVQYTVTGTRQTSTQWRLNLPRDIQPGFYRTLSILPEGSAAYGTLSLLSEERSWDASSTGAFVPALYTVAEAAFSPYQTVAVTFEYPDVDPAVTSASFDVLLQGMPSLGILQTDIFCARNRCDPRGDYLVKAPVPCFVSVALNVSYRPEYGQPDLATLQQAIAQAVNSLDVSSLELQASVIIDAAGSVLTNKGYVSLPMTLRGDLLLPTGVTTRLIGTSKLTIPSNEAIGVSARNTAFFLDASNVSITFTALPLSQV